MCCVNSGSVFSQQLCTYHRNPIGGREPGGSTNAIVSIPPYAQRYSIRATIAERGATHCGGAGGWATTVPPPAVVGDTPAEVGNIPAVMGNIPAVVGDIPADQGTSTCDG